MVNLHVCLQLIYVEVFGIYDEVSRKVFCTPVRQRNRATLVPLIKYFVPRGRRITSDSWGAYSKLRYEGYRHLVVIHKKYPIFQEVPYFYDIYGGIFIEVLCILRNFVDPRSGAHTQNIERSWRNWKEAVSGARVVNDLCIGDYLYSWQFRFNRSQSGATHNQIIDDQINCWV